MLTISVLAATPCYIYLEAELDKGYFTVEFTSLCQLLGSQLQVTLTPNINGAPLVFSKTVVVDPKREVKVDFRCADIIPYNTNCDAALSALKTNITGTIVVADLANPVAHPDETFPNVFIEVDYKDNKLDGEEIGIIVGCSVGGVVLIVIIVCVACYYKKKNAALKQPLLNIYQQQPPVQQFGAMPVTVPQANTVGSW
ncbi:Hypothetical_protein [Hexamita inflata]|uniref:Hypothetical_protein n=1 Tax=Hexamita inflata TaxID=28002 RepID=A0AA86TV16_9EUKA|nr:Hypothetical protein HINF_LOCUS10308 [Hexamita inflata]